MLEVLKGLFVGLTDEVLFAGGVFEHLSRLDVREVQGLLAFDLLEGRVQNVEGPFVVGADEVQVAGVVVCNEGD